jgi:hypothetical protein
MESHGLANRPGEPYPATFRFQWTHRESNSDLRHARAVSCLWTMSPTTFSGPAGESNPDLLVASQASSRWTSSPFIRGPSGNRTRPSALPRQCAAAAPTDLRFPITVIPDGIEPSLSWMSPRCLCPWTTGSGCSDRGGRRTHKITRLSTSSLCQFAYPAVSCRFGCRTRRAELMKLG